MGEGYAKFFDLILGSQKEQEAPWATMTRANSEDYIALQNSDDIM